MTRFLYHATFRARISSIKKLGLGAKNIKNWEFSKDGVVCLTDDADVANSFCECADDVADSVYNSGIIVLAIPVNALDRNYLKKDENINTEDNTNLYFEYYKVIRPEFLYVVTSKNGIVGRLLGLSRVPAYE